MFRDEAEEENERISRPEKPRFVRVVDENGEPVKRSKRARSKNYDAIAVLVIDGNDRVLRALEWDLVTLERALERAHAKGTSEVMLARGLSEVGEDAGGLVNREIRNALVRRAKAKKKTDAAAAREAKAREAR